jgi:SAM-dependent methyltransferase
MVDIDAEMLRAAESRVPQAAGVLASVTALPFPQASFDQVVANFVINHVSDPRLAMAELTRVLRPGGWLAATIWASGPSVMGQLWSEVVEGGGAEPLPAERLPKDKEFPRSQQGLQDLFRQAGLVAVGVRPVEWTLRMDPDDFWLGPATGIAGIGKVYAAQTPTVREAMKEHYDIAVRELTVNGQFELPSMALLGYGHKPQAIDH